MAFPYDDLFDGLLNSAPMSAPGPTDFEEKIAKATAAMTAVLEANQGKHVHLLVFQDMTQSMEHLMKKTRAGMASVVNALQDLECTLTIAVVGYRDPVDKCDDTHSVLEWTGDVDKFSRFMAECKARGGGDDAEDWAGGMQIAQRLMQEVPKDETAILCHVADAPAHGLADGRMDNHDNDHERSRLIDQVAMLKEAVPEDFEYILFPMHGDLKLKPMRDLYERATSKDWVDTVLRTLHGDDFTAGFVSSIVESSMRSRTDKVTAPPDIIRTLGLATHVRDHSEADPTRTLDLFGARVRTVSAPESRDMRAFVSSLKYYATPVYTPEALSVSFHGFARFMAAPVVNSKPRPAELEVRSVDTANDVIRVQEHPFARGGERLAFAACLIREVPEKLLESAKLNPELLAQAPGVPEDIVFKVPRRASCPAFAESKMAVQLAALGMAQMYNALLDKHSIELPGIEVLAPMAVTFPDDGARVKKPGASFCFQAKSLEGEVVMAEPAIPRDAGFFKYINNDGRRNTALNTELTQTIDAFVLFCAYLTDCNYVPTDIQGARVDGKVMLTDFAAACRNHLAFEEAGTNLGSAVVDKVVHDSRRALLDTTIYSIMFDANGICKHADEKFRTCVPPSFVWDGKKRKRGA